MLAERDEAAQTGEEAGSHVVGCISFENFGWGKSSRLLWYFPADRARLRDQVDAKPSEVAGLVVPADSSVDLPGQGWADQAESLA